MSHQPVTATHDQLDGTLPEELRLLVRYGGPMDPAKAEATLADPDPAGANEQDEQTTTEATDMAVETQNAGATNAPKIMTADEVKDLAQRAVASVFEQKDREAALASEIGKYINEANEAKRALASASGEIATLKSEVDTAKAEAKRANDEKSKLDTDKGEIVKKYDKAKADLDEATKKLAKVEAEKTVASRKQAMAKKKVKPDGNFAKKAVASAEDTGALQMSDEEFTDRLADFEDAAEPESAEAAAKKPAAGKKGDDDGQENGGGKVPPAKGKASDEADDEAASTTNAPAAPNLDGVDAVAAAQASLLTGGTPAPDDMVAKFARTFGCG